MSDTYPIAPHGGALVNLLASDDAAANLAAEAANLPKLVVNERELSDLEMLATGALLLLNGFFGRAAAEKLERDAQASDEVSISKRDAA